ncbi:hypothetical protein [Saccharibacter floricola]|uniref:Uncharacterized protein n=1 Tax=Saccharibacter floricola DSM 15669 TaxID=1123227 RepID=A0ABQ0P148_9PROT|nr:hypothetical protein [Saccharibacter floricola]GBQ08822.1 hypothetical protein AA15669_1922 [Saccharibacter floricola DSM 15669]
MRSLILLALSVASLTFHKAHATALPTLCTSDEIVVINGETPRGFASLCAGLNNVWHYRFGEPGHITYIFPRDNKPADTYFHMEISQYGHNLGGTAYAFVDRTTAVFIFDGLATHWGRKRNILNKVSGVTITRLDHTYPSQDMPFIRSSPGGMKSWQQSPELMLSNFPDLSSHPNSFHLPSPIGFYVSTDEGIPPIYRAFSQLSHFSIPLDLRPPEDRLQPSLCSPTEKIIVSGETPKGYASLCADVTSWHYRFGKPNSISYIFPHNNSPAHENFSYNSLGSSEDPKEGYIYHFNDKHVSVSIFSMTHAWWENRFYRDHNASDIPSYDISDRMEGTVGGVITGKGRDKPRHTSISL